MAEKAATSSPSPLPASSSVSAPPETSPAETNSPAGADDSVASTWVGSFYQGVTQIKTLLVKFKNQHKKSVPEDLTYRIEVVKSFLRYLEFEVEMTPTIKQTYNLDKVLEAVEHEDFRNHVPADITATCRRLLAMYNEENWDQEHMQADIGADVEAQAASPTSRTSTPAHDAPETANMRLPAPDHPIWGLNGIMHGLALSPSTRSRMYVVDPRYAHKRKNAKVFGHNEFEPGMWWPYQKLAHFYGAHGAHIQGITGDPMQGAYSIVTSGSSSYGDMDQDFGERLLYSADNSHDNKDPNNIVYTSSRTKSLHKSMETGKPVRVLRSSGGKKAYTPEVGIRYDGLYRVAAVHRVKNEHGGLYEQFELIRLPDQRSLDDIQRNVPSKKQQDDFAKIKNGY